MDNLGAIDEDTIPTRVASDGDVEWHPPGILKMSCEMDSTYFPFDRQTCTIVVTSFGFTMNEVSIQSQDGVRTDFYSENGDWAIKGMSVDRTEYYDNGHPYSRLTFSVEVKRRSTFHWINIIIPILVNSFLICFVFLLPADSGEKMGYSLTCLLAFVVLLTLLAADMPTSAKHTALLEVYITLTLGFSAMSVFLSQLVLHVHFRDDELYQVEGRILKLTKLSGLPSGQGAGGGAPTRDRRDPAALRADSLATVPPTPPVSRRKTLNDRRAIKSSICITLTDYHHSIFPIPISRTLNDRRAIKSSIYITLTDYHNSIFPIPISRTLNDRRAIKSSIYITLTDYHHSIFPIPISRTLSDRRATNQEDPRKLQCKEFPIGTMTILRRAWSTK
ncbi:neuronal acetylcholine receptor subunit alpha-3 [Plakobranchus ocellatus]|uniref:Neuronal acetylcholine receptor subunit alpha-3 n=1 Tax=Plakobranchus ocellatus TaxID=259542 RepID=A0AAV4BDH9_9GAST|nr:neuronal acetylcholine receptor subunit alpha-3 [Plakobranchus ocellatus]